MMVPCEQSGEARNAAPGVIPAHRRGLWQRHKRQAAGVERQGGAPSPSSRFIPFSHLKEPNHALPPERAPLDVDDALCTTGFARADVNPGAKASVGPSPRRAPGTGRADATVGNKRPKTP